MQLGEFGADLWRLRLDRELDDLSDDGGEVQGGGQGVHSATFQEQIMAHSCQECGLTCHCGGDIDDCCFDGTPEALACLHCDEFDDDDDDEWDDDDPYEDA